MTGPTGAQPKLAVVGHVEWVTFALVGRVPLAGEIVHAEAPFSEPAGGGAVAAVQLARLAGSCVLFTALGRDDHGRLAVTRLNELGIEVRAAWRDAPSRTAVTLLDAQRERTIVTFGERLEPTLADGSLGWSDLAAFDGVYFTAGDAPALHASRAASTLVASPRAIDALGHNVTLDALVFSDTDAFERAEAAQTTAGAEAPLIVRTEGARGGVYTTASGQTGSWPASPLPAPPVDSYGCGDSFAAGLTYGLARGLAPPDALALAARCGAACLTGRGPYAAQLTSADLADLETKAHG